MDGTISDPGLANSETGDYEFELWQDGIPVAEVGAPDLKRAFNEICHYAAMYGQDGPVKIIQVQRRAITFVETPSPPPPTEPQGVDVGEQS